jgi:hypothetical protein
MLMDLVCGLGPDGGLDKLGFLGHTIAELGGPILRDWAACFRANHGKGWAAMSSPERGRATLSRLEEKSDAQHVDRRANAAGRRR